MSCGFKDSTKWFLIKVLRENVICLVQLSFVFDAFDICRTMF